MRLCTATPEYLLRADSAPGAVLGSSRGRRAGEDPGSTKLLLQYLEKQFSVYEYGWHFPMKPRILRHSEVGKGKSVQNGKDLVPWSSDG